ncbi:membrane protein [Streptomyces griseoflavus]|uniref:membrane protein n=1 Tax=Streptomyces rimosus TaxID=1927 RepID=UPI0004C792A6|nr:membrane protein [Streptomyces rimosus]KOG65362.1 membrane protein [Streptomyces griseoflavus]KWT62946.1 hypothetical protein ADL21_05360 [Streptomyces albus subsp. albus]
MHMNSAPHLLSEDRAEFARLLDEALRTAEYRPEMVSAAGKHLNTEQLRTMALSATSAIAACATAEYRHYVRLRDELRAPEPAPDAGGVEGREEKGTTAGSTGMDLATSVGEAAESAGAGLAAMLAVLAPVLAGIAALLFLIIGYVLRTIGTDPAAAQPMISVGWVFAALTAAGALIAMASLVHAAWRNGSTSLRAPRGDGRGGRAKEVDAARDAWRQALLERGILPFLREALTDPATVNGRDTAPYVPRRGVDGGSRIPTLGYSRPDFTSPDGGPPASPRPRFTSPDFTSPDYGGPDHHPE